MKKTQVLVIGGGPAGLLAASRAAQRGAEVLLLEKNKMTGRKLRITGKGRCNVTNAGEIRQFIEEYPGQGRFLYSAFARFFNEQLCALLEAQGVALKTERGGRIFPVSDSANEVADALTEYAQQSGVRIWTGTEALRLHFETDSGGCRVCGAEIQTKNGKDRIEASTVIVATGGLSYPLTGSTGDGYRWAKQAGHHITDLQPGLVPLETRESWVSELSGLSLKNVEASLWAGPEDSEICLDRQQGEMLFAHFGVTGPIILSLSRAYAAAKGKPARLKIDLKPALTAEVLDKRLQRDFGKYQKKQLKNALNDLLPKALIPVVIQTAELDGESWVSQITREERGRLGKVLKGLKLTIQGTRPMAEAIITVGGIDIKEIDPKTMASKKAEGLYFAGEVLDVDGYTGGYNLQAAFSTGWIAGEAAAVQALKIEAKLREVRSLLQAEGPQDRKEEDDDREN
ncbi:MAG TPA: aminoacetone oxidase family FAD-binding enzyme [Peptococcaceae bacterium]|nr:aminoacetone oxidase family FAD-binding enzyme [Peptococcaceae bacterium]